ncbi:MAG TPA: radical SAM protein [Acidobacteriota bacterium]|nr:radical SAM protein [Acidobacteriota bacterium]
MLEIEQGPIRPPSEAQSLLLRVTRNCSWNNCEFCHIYKGKRFSLRTVEEVKKDIDAIKATVAEVESISWNMGFGGEINGSVVRAVLHGPRPCPEGYRSILLWLHRGGENVFLQDANNLAHRTNDLVEILTYLKETFPTIQRITTYSRARTIARKSLEELRALHDAGLSRVHVGLESGYDPLLKLVEKGVTAKELIDAGQKVKQSGISLSEYIMPGLGGKKMWREHAVETARVLSQINPDFIRVRTFKALEIMPIYRKIVAGELELMGDDEIIAEERLLIENLQGITSYFASDHILNLLEELDGKFPEAKEKMLSTIDRYLGMSLEERNNFRLGRRAGYYRIQDDMLNPELRTRVNSIMQRIEKENPGGLDPVISELMESFI